MEQTVHNQNLKRDIVQEFFENFDLKLFLYIARKTMFFVGIMLFFSLLIPYLYIRYTTPIFETKATLIKKKEIKTGILDDSKNADFLKSNDEEKINRDIQIIKSDFLLDNIVDSLNLSIQYFKRGRIPGKRFEMASKDFFEIEPSFQIYNSQLYGQDIGLTFSDKNKFDLSYNVGGKDILVKDIQTNTTYSNKDLKIKVNVFDKNLKGNYTILFNNKESIKNYILSDLAVVNGSPNIFFSLKSNNSKKSEYIINQVLKGFLSLDQKENSEKVENSIIYIKNYIDTINAQLRISQLEKANYIKANSVYSPTSQLESNLVELEQYHQKADELNAKIYSITKLKNEISNSSRIDNVFAGEDKELNALINERNKLLIDYKISHPTVSIVNKQIKDRLTMLNNSFRLEIENYQNRMNQMKMRRNEAQSSLASLPSKDMEFNKLQKEVEIKEKYVIDLIEKQIQYLILKSSISSDYLIIQPPKTSPQQIYPRKSLLYGTGIALFIFLSFSLILYRYIWFDKVVSVDEIKRRTNVPILGYIPYVEEAYDEKNVNANSPESKLVVLTNPKSRTSEIFKKMRASLKYTTFSNYKTICSTSTISGEGKTFVLINLAAVHALLDKKVLIIDLDMRKPRIAKSFKLPNKIGMSNLLTDESVSIDECIQKNNELKNLDVITSGPIPPNPSELIISDKFDKLLTELKNRYDYIFIDTPPVGLVNESIEIVNKVDIPLYLVRFNYSKKDFVNVLNDTNILKKNSNLYLVINHYGDGASSYVNYSYGGYGYGNTYGYNEDSDYHKKHEGYYTDSPKIIKQNIFDKIGKIFDWNL